jgi:hypothetical protein
MPTQQKNEPRWPTKPIPWRQTWDTYGQAMTTHNNTKPSPSRIAHVRGPQHSAHIGATHDDANASIPPECCLKPIPWSIRKQWKTVTIDGATFRIDENGGWTRLVKGVPTLLCEDLANPAIEAKLGGIPWIRHRRAKAAIKRKASIKAWIAKHKRK